MSNLVLDLRPGELIIVNGTPIRFRTRSRIELTAKARFLFGKQILEPGQFDSPLRRIYFALQSAYIGQEPDRERDLEAARFLITQFQQSAASHAFKSMLDQALVAAEQDDFYAALRLVRRTIQHEEAADPQQIKP